MSTTTTETVQTPPPLTVLSRVASIPLVSLSLETIDQRLSSNAYTRSLYPTAKELSSTAYKYTEPIQTRFAPLIIYADGFANKAVDAVEARYPYPFTVKPEDVTEYVRERRQNATELINHSIDETVKNPALHVATEIDHRFAPIIDFVEGVVKHITNSHEGPSAPDAKYQYQRVLALTKNLYGYTNEQLKHLQAQSALLQRATETAHSISSNANSSLANAQSLVQQLSDNMLAELQKLQANTTAFTASIQSSAANTVQSHIPPHIHQAFAELSHTLSATVSDFSSTITAKDIPLPEKIGKIAADVRERILPVLGSVAKAVGVALLPKPELATPEVDTNVLPSKDELPELSKAVSLNGEHPEPNKVVPSEVERPEPKIEHPEPNVKHPETDIEHPEQKKELPSKDKHHKAALPKETSGKSGGISSKHGAKERVPHTGIGN